MIRTNEQRGVTLVELMIALVITSILTLGALELFSSVNNLGKVNENLSRNQETARAVLDLIGQEIQMAGYSGCVKSSLSDGSNTMPRAIWGINNGIAFGYYFPSTTGAVAATCGEATNNLALRLVAITSCENSICWREQNNPTVSASNNPTVGGTAVPVTGTSDSNPIRASIVSIELLVGTSVEEDTTGIIWTSGNWGSNADTLFGRARAVRFKIRVQVGNTGSPRFVEREYERTYLLRNLIQS